MALSRTAKYYRDNPEARKKHRKSSAKWNKTKKGESYKKEYNKENADKTASRNKARRKMVKAGKVRKGQHVDHINRNANDNSSSNLRATSAKYNLRRLKK
jgi:hypothetical protein